MALDRHDILKQVLTSARPGQLLTAAWLTEQGVSSQPAYHDVQAGWLTRSGMVVFCAPEGPLRLPEWMAVHFPIQVRRRRLFDDPTLCVSTREIPACRSPNRNAPFWKTLWGVLQHQWQEEAFDPKPVWLTRFVASGASGILPQRQGGASFLHCRTSRAPRS